MSERRACRVIGADRKSMRYRSQRDDDTELRLKLRELAQQRRRFGYRRLHILLRREGVVINRKKTQRLYREEKLEVRRRRSRRRAIGARAPAPVLALPNQRWSLDFVHDQMASGAQHRRRCDPRVPARGAGYVDLGTQGRARAKRSDRRARQAGHDRQRQRPMLGSSSGNRPADLIAPIRIGAAVFLIQMASIVKECALGHSKHRIHRSWGSWSSPSLR